MSRPDVPRSLSPERLAAALTEVGGSARPDYLDDIVTRAARTRQRPAWTFLERWLPMSMLATAPPLAPVRPLPRVTPAGVLTILAPALVTGALVGASLLATSPGPLPGEGVRNGLIAFDSDNDVWVVEPDGTDPRRVTDTPDYESSPMWSPDGSRLAVWTAAGDATIVRIMDADGRIEETIAAPDGATFPSPGSPGCSGAQAVWSPDGRTLAASALDSSYRSSVAIIDVETGAGRLLDVDMPVCRYAWSPDGSLLAFTGGPPGAQALYVAAPDGSGLESLSPEGREAWLYGFAPDGTWILGELEDVGTVRFALDRTYRAAPDDMQDRSRGVGSRAMEWASMPSWGPVSVTPDGRSAAFLRGGVAFSYAPQELYVGPLDGSSEPWLVAAEVGGPGPWSPDGTLLSAWTPQFDEILILDPSGGTAPVSVPSPGNEGGLSWQALH